MNSSSRLPLLFACAASALIAQTPPPTGTERPDLAAGVDTARNKLEIASPEAVDRTVRKLAGRPVQGANGERLGTIKDFVIDKKTGEVVYAVVSSGGVLGAGDTLRLVPLHALKPAADGTAAFVVKISRASWDRSPAVIEEAFGAGIISIPDEQRRELSRVYGVPLRPHALADASAAPRSREAERAASPWVRASLLRGKDVHAAGRQVGEIEEIVIDLDRKSAAALLDPQDDVIAGKARVLVPLTELSLAGDTRNAIATTFTPNDFAHLDPAASQRHDANLLPTGRTSAEQNPPASAEATLASAARSARQALDNHVDLARADIRVTPENGMLILRGRVRTEQLKDQAETAVKDAASGIRLQNYLVVDPR